MPAQRRDGKGCAAPGNPALTGYRASRWLSFLLWNQRCSQVIEERANAPLLFVRNRLLRIVQLVVDTLNTRLSFPKTG